MSKSEEQSLQSLDLLEERVQKLEDVLKGTRHIHTQHSLSDTLSVIDSSLQNVLATREKLGVLRATEQLEKLLNFELENDDLVSADIKLNVVLSEIELIERAVLLYEKIKSMKQNLTSAHIEAIPQFSEKLSDLSSRHVAFSKSISKYSDDVKELFDDYSRLISTTSHQFVIWDQLLTDSSSN